MRVKPLKIKVLLLAPLAVFLGVLLIPSIREGLLLGLGNALVHADPLEPVDAIVIAVDGGGPEVLEAADLVRSGLANKVWVLSGPPDELGLEFARHGLPYTDGPTVAVQTLHALGVKQAEIASPQVDGSNAEAQMLPAWVKSRHYRHIILIAAADHSRRVHRLVSRALAAEPMPPQISIRYSRYAQFKPNRWWQDRGGIRTVIVEHQKLLLDFLSHPTDW